MGCQEAGWGQAVIESQGGRDLAEVQESSHQSCEDGSCAHGHLPRLDGSLQGAVGPRGDWASSCSEDAVVQSPAPGGATIPS